VHLTQHNQSTLLVKKKLTNSLENKESISLQLYVSGMSQKSMMAIKNIKNFCEKHIHHNFKLEIIDLYKSPEAAQINQVVFSPSLIKNYPLPRKVLIGTFSDADKLVKSLNLVIPEN